MQTCPKCGYVRKPVEQAPDWQCPACGIAYVKFVPKPEAAPPAPDPAPAPSKPPAAEPVQWRHVDRPTPRSLEEFADGAAEELMANMPATWTPLNFWSSLLVGAALVLFAAYLFLAAFGLTPRSAHVAGTERMWTLLMAMALGSFGGLVIALTLRLGRAALRGAYYAFFGAFLLALNLWALNASVEFLGHRSIGRLNGATLVTLFCVAVDLYVVSAVILAIARAARLAGAERYRALRAVICLVLAYALYSTGGLEKTYAALHLAPPGPVISSGALQVERVDASALEVPFEHFAGNWRARALGRPMSKFGDDVIRRVEIRLADRKASVQLWRACAQNECDAGTFVATMESRHAGQAQALHVAGSSGDQNWIVSVRPQRKGIRLEERRAFGSSPTPFLFYADLRRD